jgi:hypothetical protein
MKYIIPLLFIFTSCSKNDAARTVPQDSLVNAAGVIRAYPTTVIGSKIQWKFIVDADHDKNFFDSVAAVPSGAIRVYFPLVKKINTFLATGDEQLKYYQMGASVNMTYADLFLSTYVTNGGSLVGNNGVGWNRIGMVSIWDINRDSTTGLTRVNIKNPTFVPVVADDYAKLTITYTGTNIRFVRRVYSGLGSYNTGFYLTDYLGNIIKGKSDPLDRVVMASNPTQQNVNCYSVSGDSLQIKIFNSTANIWVSGQFIK